jgi:hypothetical protein
MKTRALWIGLLTAAALAAAGCGGGNGNGDEGADVAAGGACTLAKTALVETVGERDRLFVDQRLGEATAACADDLPDPGNVEDCSAARADLEAAAAETTPPPDLDSRVESAVKACVDTTITSTIPAP